MSSKNDESFGQFAVTANYISKAELREALEELKKREGKGERTSLDRVLIDMGMMLAVQIESIQAKQKRRVVFCPACGMKLNVFLFKAGQRIKCTHCQKSLIVPQIGKDPTLAPSGVFPTVGSTKKPSPVAEEDDDEESGEDDDATIISEEDLLLLDEPAPSGPDAPTRRGGPGPKKPNTSRTPTRPSIKKPRKNDD